MAEHFGVIGAARFEVREPPAETGELLAELAQCSTADLAKLFGAGARPSRRQPSIRKGAQMPSLTQRRPRCRT